MAVCSSLRLNSVAEFSIQQGNERKVEVNPYSSPSMVPSDNTGEQPDLERRRPPGIWLLSAWYILLGAMLLVAVGYLLFWPESEPSGPRRVPVSDTILISCGMVMVAVIWTMAICLWRGATWAWWLVSFYCLSTAIFSALALPTPLLKHEPADIQLYADVVKHGGRFIVSVLFVLYFFKRNVLQFFGLESFSKRKALTILFAATVCLVLLVATATGVMFYAQLGGEPKWFQR